MRDGPRRVGLIWFSFRLAVPKLDSEPPPRVTNELSRWLGKGWEFVWFEPEPHLGWRALLRKDRSAAGFLPRSTRQNVPAQDNWGSMTKDVIILVGDLRDIGGYDDSAQRPISADPDDS